MLGGWPSPSLENAFVCLLLIDFKSFHFMFNKLTSVHESLFVLYLARLDPCHDLIAIPLELLDLLLEIRFKFLLLIRIFRIINLVPDAIEDIDAFLHLLQYSVDLALEFSAGSHADIGDESKQSNIQSFNLRFGIDRCC